MPILSAELKGYAMNPLRLIFNFTPYRGQVEREKALSLYTSLLVMVGFLSLYFLIVSDWWLPTKQATLFIAASQNPVYFLVLVATYLLAIISYALIYSGRSHTASWLMPFIFYLAPVTNVLSYPPSFSVSFSEGVNILTLVIFILLMAFFNGYRGLVAGALIVAITFLSDSGRDLATVGIDFFFYYLLYFAAIFALIIFYLRFARISRVEAEDIARQERLHLAEITTAIARKASERPNLEALLNYALSLIRENYPQFYHAQVFLVDDKRVQARLVASTGEAGRILLARAHALTVGSLSVIGQVTFRGEPIIAYAGTSDTIHRPNDVLPRTRTELAFPMRIQNEVVGALDLQSMQVVQLRDDEKQILQSLADSLALAIDNVRQYENSRARTLENQRLAEQARSALNEVQRLNKRLIGRAWSDYLKDKGQYGLELDVESSQSRPFQGSTPALDEAIRERTLIQHKQHVAIPLQIRDQVIGALEFEVDDAEALSDDELELLREVTERLGLAAENARLVEESQRSAQREALINELSSRLQSANTVETTLTEAARGLRETLRAERIIIRLGSTPKKTEAVS